MYETSKAVQRRLHDSNFISRYFRGKGIDIGAGNDPLGQYIELFPLMESCLSYDKADGNAETMKGIADGQYDFVHSSHCLEDLSVPGAALQNWFRILKPGGHMIVTVPDEDMYEQGVFPSTFNADHKHTFTIFKEKGWTEASYNLFGLIMMLGADADIIKIERLTGTYRFGLDRMDQTRTPIGEAAIEFVIRKRPQPLLMEAKLTYIKKKRIALHRPGAIGDIIMTLSLAPLLKEKYPDHDVHYFCNPWIGHELAGLMKAAGIDQVIDCGVLNREKMDEYEQVINLIGYPLKEGYPEKPMAKHLIEYFAIEMGVSIPEKDGVPILPHLTLDPGPRPDVPLCYATIHPQAGWSVYKNWEARKWEEVIAACPDIKFYQIGSATDDKLAGADTSYMGKPVAESIGLMAHAALHLGIDSWSNHATHIQWGDLGFTPAIILWGSTQWDAAGYRHNVNISLGLHCQPCFREDPKISRMPRGPCINPPDQTYDKPQHACMADIGVERVLGKLREIIP